jgi:hypothetical protein
MRADCGFGWWRFWSASRSGVLLQISWTAWIPWGLRLLGGLIAGAIIEAAQWSALRQWVSWLWIPATSVGMALGLAAGAALVDYGIDR